MSVPRIPHSEILQKERKKIPLTVDEILDLQEYRRENREKIADSYTKSFEFEFEFDPNGEEAVEITYPWLRGGR